MVNRKKTRKFEFSEEERNLRIQCDYKFGYTVTELSESHYTRFQEIDRNRFGFSSSFGKRQILTRSLQFFLSSKDDLSFVSRFLFSESIDIAKNCQCLV